MLTAAQLQTLKTELTTDPTGQGYPAMIAAGTFSPIVDSLNGYPTPDFMVWRTDTPVTDISDATDWAKFTPVDAPDLTAIFTNRALVIQTKQMNLQTMLLMGGRSGTLDTSKANIRAGLRDAVIQLPAGASGAAVTAGGVSGATVLAACTRKARRIEKVLSTGNATTGSTTANLLGYEGAVSLDDVVTASRLP